MNNITTYVTLIDTKTTYSRLRTTDIDILFNSLPPADQQNKRFLVGEEMLILEDTGKYVKWKVDSMEFRIMDGEIYLPSEANVEISGNENPFNTELRIYITRLDP